MTRRPRQGVMSDTGGQCPSGILGISGLPIVEALKSVVHRAEDHHIWKLVLQGF